MWRKINEQREREIFNQRIRMRGGGGILKVSGILRDKTKDYKFLINKITPVVD